MDEQDRILARVKKMLNLAHDKAASEGERENALRMAHATLAKHNLSMAEAEAHGEQPQEERVRHSIFVKNRPWRSTCAMAVSRMLFCMTYLHRLDGGKARYYFIGKQSNAIWAAKLTEYVCASIFREGEKLSRAQPGGYSSSFCASFQKGAAESVQRRCHELRKQAEQVSQQAASTGTSLVLASVYRQEQQANEAFLDQQGVKLRYLKDRSRDTGTSGYAAGRQFGDAVNLSKQIKDTTVKGALQ